MAIKINGNTVIDDSQNFTSTGTISATGNITTSGTIKGNIQSTGPISTTGNVTAGNVIVNGIVTATGNVYGNTLILSDGANISGTLRSGPIVVDYNAGGNIDVPGFTGAVMLRDSAGHLGYNGNVSFDYGNNALYGFKVMCGTGGFGTTEAVLNIGNSNPHTINIGGSATSINFGNSTGVVSFAGAISAAGNITGNYILGNGSQLTGIDATSIQNGTANVRTFNNGNVTTSAGGTANVLNVTSTGTITTGSASATGTIVGGNLVTTGTISATGNATAGNVLTGGLVSATGAITGANITGANFLTAGLVSATGNATAGNVNTAQVRNASAALTLSTGSGDINLQPASGNVVLPGTLAYINNVQQPVNNQDAATKLYVDNMASTQLTYHTGVTAATTANLATTTGGTITYNQPNGAGNGIGATITTTGSFNLIDTANVQTANTRILVKDEGNAVLNGVYVWSNATVITRATDADEYGANSITALSINDYFFVSSGNVNKGSAWICDAPTGTITFGTSNISFAQFSSSQTYTAGNGITLAGTVITAKTDNTTTAFDGNGNIIVKASAALTTPNIGAATGTSLSVTGTISAGGNIVSATNISAANITAGTNLSTTGNISGGNITMVMTSGTISASANITGGNILTAGIMSSTGNGIHGNVLSAGLVSAAGNIRADGFISAAGNVVGSNLSTTGNISGGNIAMVMTSGTISASANITGGNILTAGIMSSTGNGIHGNVLSAGLISAGGNIVAATNVSAGNIIAGTTLSTTGTISGGNISIAMTSGTISASGNITGGNLTVGTGTVTVGNIVNANGNGVGNIGSSSLYFNTVFAKATSAQYADLAEKYTADAEYEPGTVVMFGGSAEVTLCVNDGCSRVAGVISTNPSYIMNSTLEAAHVATVALTGRVPTKVTGSVRKGDLMVSAGNGSARAEADPKVGTVIGKALADSEGDAVVEVVVGRF